jgi:hypothetical protein
MKAIQSALRFNELLDFCTQHSSFHRGSFFSSLPYPLPLIEAFISPPPVFNDRSIFLSSTGINLDLICADAEY